MRVEKKVIYLDNGLLETVIVENEVISGKYPNVKRRMIISLYKRSN